MKPIYFVQDPDSSGRNQKVIGTLNEDGSWTGHRELELEVRMTMLQQNIIPDNPEGRMALMAAFSGTRLFATEDRGNL